MGLSHPVTSRVQERYGDEVMHVATVSMCGYRRSMEDSHSIKMRLPRHPNTAFIGVFDGHGGQMAAQFCASYLALRIDALDEFSDAELQRCVMQFDADFCVPENANRDHGSTCVFVLIQFETDPEAEAAVGEATGGGGGGGGGGPGANRPMQVIVCNTGDSRAIWGTRDPSPVAEALTEDHKPTQETEKKRIEAAGGHVAAARVDGDLALSRAIGDWKYKCNPDVSAEKQKVIALPDITRKTVHAGDYLLVACDGIFERLENEEVIAILRSNMGSATENVDLLEVLDTLLHKSLEAGSKDNMTAVLVLLEPNATHQLEPKMVFGPIHPYERNFMSTYIKFAEERGFGKECRAFIHACHDEQGTTPLSYDEPSSTVDESIVRELLWRSNVGVFLADDDEDSGDDDGDGDGDADMAMQVVESSQDSITVCQSGDSAEAASANSAADPATPAPSDELTHSV